MTMDEACAALITAAESMTVEQVHRHPFAALDKMRGLIRELRAALASQQPAPTEDERRRIMSAIDSILNPFDRTTSEQEHLVLDAAEKWANSLRGPVTDEMVEAAARAVHSDYVSRYPEDPPVYHAGPGQPVWRHIARAALEAAEAVR